MSTGASEIARMTGGDDVAANRRRTHAEEYRNEAVGHHEWHEDSGKTIKQCAADLGTDPKTPDDWVIKRRGTGRVSQTRDEAQGEPGRAQRRIRELEEQLELLKKAAAFNAEDRSADDRHRLTGAEKTKHPIAMMAHPRRGPIRPLPVWSRGLEAGDEAWERPGEAVMEVRGRDRRCFGARKVHARLLSDHGGEFDGLTLYRVRKRTVELGIKTWAQPTWHGAAATSRGTRSFRSNRGSQHAGKAFVEWARSHDVRLSVGRTGSSHGDAVAESFLGTPRNGWLHHERVMDAATTKNPAIESVESCYNRYRPHEAVGDRVPAELVQESFDGMDIALSDDKKVIMIA